MIRQAPGQACRCRWVRLRLQRFLDRDPAAPLTDREARAVHAHLAHCQDCSGAWQQYRELRTLLASLGRSADPDPAAVMRVRQFARAAIGGDRC